MNKRKFGVVEKEWMIGQYHCVIAFTMHGCYCGYIGVPKGHFLHGVSYTDKHPKLIAKKDHEFNENYMGLFCNTNNSDNTMSPDMYFSAHCGFTYSGKSLGYDEMKEDFWYFGFDCQHFCDKNNYKKALDLGLLTQEEYEYKSKYPALDDEVFRDFDYVKNNLEKVAQEFIDLEG